MRSVTAALARASRGACPSIARPLGCFRSHSIRFAWHSRVRAVIADSDGELTIRRWLRTPAPIWLIGPLAALILAAPAWLLWAELRDFPLKLDDFDYIGQSRDWPTARCAFARAAQRPRCSDLPALDVRARRSCRAVDESALGPCVGIVSGLDRGDACRGVCRGSGNELAGGGTLSHGGPGNLDGEPPGGDLVFRRPGPLGGNSHPRRRSHLPKAGPRKGE